MAVRQIRFQGDQILRKKCRIVERVDEKICQILEDMMDTLHSTENGAALAANQVGILKRLVVIDYCGQTFKLVNPVIVEREGEQECLEGCLSFPNRFVRILRPQRVVVHTLNERGEAIELVGEDEMAKCFCHELEHLEGKIFLDQALEEVRLDS